jgi:hypothetical protein
LPASPSISSGARCRELSNFGSDAEVRASKQLAANFKPCMNKSEQLTVDMQALRALASMALYRGVTTAVKLGN